MCSPRSPEAYFICSPIRALSWRSNVVACERRAIIEGTIAHTLRVYDVFGPSGVGCRNATWPNVRPSGPLKLTIVVYGAANVFGQEHALSNFPFVGLHLNHT